MSKKDSSSNSSHIDDQVSLDPTVTASIGDTLLQYDSYGSPALNPSASAPTVDNFPLPEGHESLPVIPSNTASIELPPTSTVNENDKIPCEFSNCNVCKFLKSYRRESEHLEQDSPHLSEQFMKEIYQSMAAVETVLVQSKPIFDLGKAQRSLVKKTSKNMQKLALDVSEKFRKIHRQYCKTQRHQTERGVLPNMSLNEDAADYIVPIIDWWAQLANSFKGLREKYKASKQSRLALQADQKVLDSARAQCDHYRNQLSALLSIHGDGVQAESTAPRPASTEGAPTGDNTHESLPPQERGIKRKSWIVRLFHRLRSFLPRR